MPAVTKMMPSVSDRLGFVSKCIDDLDEGRKRIDWKALEHSYQYEMDFHKHRASHKMDDYCYDLNEEGSYYPEHLHFLYEFFIKVIGAQAFKDTHSEEITSVLTAVQKYMKYLRFWKDTTDLEAQDTTRK